MKLKPICILAAAVLSTGAYAGGQSSQGASQGQDSQSGQSQAQQSQSQGQQSSSSTASAQNPEVVKQAQEKLSAAGHDAGTPDGQMGPRTQAALKEFQQSKGLQASGQLDSQTIAALEIGTPEGTTSSSAGSSSSPSSSESGGQSKSQ